MVVVVLLEVFAQDHIDLRVGIGGVGVHRSSKGVIGVAGMSADGLEAGGVEVIELTVVEEIIGDQLVGRFDSGTGDGDGQMFFVPVASSKLAWAPHATQVGRTRNRDGVVVGVEADQVGAQVGIEPFDLGMIDGPRIRSGRMCAEVRRQGLSLVPRIGSRGVGPPMG